VIVENEIKGIVRKNAAKEHFPTKLLPLTPKAPPESPENFSPGDDFKGVTQKCRDVLYRLDDYC